MIMKKNKKVLITGVAGFIGMNVALKFLEENYDVIGIDNFSDYYDVNLKKNRIDLIKRMKKDSSFKFLQKDLNDGVLKILDEKIHGIIHLAAQPGVRYSLENPSAYTEANILGFQEILNFAERIKPEVFLYASSSSVYGKSKNSPFEESFSCITPESYYAATKRSNELMAFSLWKTKSISSLGMRFFTVYGPWGRPDMAPHLFINSIYNSRKINVFNYGNQSRDFTYIDDITLSIFKLYNNFKKIKTADIVNVGSGNPIKLKDFIFNIEKITNLKLSKNYIEAQKGDVTDTFADTNKLFSLINYLPETKFLDGLTKQIDWYKKYYKNNKL